MFRGINVYRRDRQAGARYRQADYSLQIFLWALWTAAVVLAGYLSRHAGVELSGMIIRCLVVGIIGLVVLTKVEMWLQPWRFLD